MIALYSKQNEFKEFTQTIFLSRSETEVLCCNPIQDISDLKPASYCNKYDTGDNSFFRIVQTML